MTSETDVLSVTGGMWTRQQTWHRPAGSKDCTCGNKPSETQHIIRRYYDIIIFY